MLRRLIELSANRSRLIALALLVAVGGACAALDVTNHQVQVRADAGSRLQIKVKTDGNRGTSLRIEHGGR